MVIKTIQSNLLKILLGFLIINIIWFTASYFSNTNLIVNPIELYKSLPKIWSQSMNTHLLASLKRILLGVGIAIGIGLLITFLFIQSNKTKLIIDSFVYISYPIPKLALLPIVMLLAGIGETTKIIMIVLIIVFQIIISLRDEIGRAHV